MIKVLIADDESLARRGVVLRLRDHSDMTVVGECGNGEETVRSILSLKPDLVFLDVQMPGMGGIDVLRSLPTGCVPCVIFLTAYDEYALAAFEVQALDYLLKPVDDGRFAASLGRARRLLTLERQEDLQDRLRKLLEQQDRHRSDTAVQRFAVRTGNHITFIRTEEIDWVEAVGDYAGLHVGGKTHLLRESLNSLETRLDSSHFRRVHRSAMVQVDRIARIDPLANRDCQITLRDGTLLRVSRTYSKALRDLLRNRDG